MPTNQPLSKHDWATAVVAHINSTQEEGTLYQALQASADEQEVGCDQIPDPLVDPWKALEWMRQDETQDAYDAGDPPVDYADFLTTEWDLYGPAGE